MEFMDFQLYSLAAAIVFNKIFFPNVQPGDRAHRGDGDLPRRVRGPAAGAMYFGRMGDGSVARRSCSSPSR